MSAFFSALGRIMLCTIFLMSAAGNLIPQFEGTAKFMASEGVPAATVMLAGAIAFLLIGSASVIAGYHARFGAALLGVFLVLATYFFHDFWNFQGEAATEQMIAFLKNLGLLGAMVILMTNGSGAGSWDRRPSAAPSPAA